MVTRSHLLLALAGALLALPVAASARPHARKADPLARFLRAYLAPVPDGTRYAVARADLDGDGAKEAIVYLTGRAWCGSGGCLTLVLSPTHGRRRYRVLMRATVSRLPIRLLPGTSDGWRDIAIAIGGGGAVPGHAAMRFDGHRYPSNPTMAPLVSGPEGRMLIDSATSTTPLRP